MTLTIISLHGPTNSGKDTLAKMICDRALGKVHHLKFADQLRRDTEDRLNLDGYKILALRGSTPRDEWERTPLVDGKSFKDWMIVTAREYAATEPYRYVDAFIKAVSKIRSGETLNPTIIVSDCRKPIEFKALERLTERLYCFRLNRPGNPSPSKALDGLLADVRMPILANDEGYEEALYSQYCEAMQTLPPWPMWREMNP